MSERCRHCTGVAYCPACDAAPLGEVAAPPRDAGVSIQFWSDALKALSKQHGECNPNNLIDSVRHHLALAEFFYLQMPKVPAPEKRAWRVGKKGAKGS